MPTPRSLTRDTAWTILGQALPLVLGLAAIPLIVRGLGPERFGVLGLIWAALGYFGLLDFGLARATTRFVADALARGSPERATAIVGATVAVQTLLGLAAGGLVLVVAPVVVNRWLGVPQELRPEVIRALVWLAVAVPFVLVLGVLRAALEASHRFDLAAMLRGVNGAAMFVMPAAIVLLGGKLVAVVASLALVRAAVCGLAARLVWRALPGVRWTLRNLASTLRPLLGFGGSAAVDNAIVPLLLYLDRFALSAISGIAAVAYYAAPYEAVTRLLIVPGGVATVLFPTFSRLTAKGGAHEQVERLVGQSVRYLLLLLGPLTALTVVFAAPLMTIWLGVTYAQAGALALRFLAVGVLLGALSHVPNSLLMGLGRADRIALLHAVELPLHAVTSWILIRRFGIAGAAAAWALRAGCDALALFVMGLKAADLPARRLTMQAGSAAGAVAGLAAVALSCSALLPAAPLLRVATGGALGLGFAVVAWSRLLGVQDRTTLLRVFGLARAVPATRQTQQRSPGAPSSGRCEGAGFVELRLTSAA